MNYYPHHIGDYKAATVHLSNEEDLTYRRLLEMYYDSERPIPLETQWVSRRLRVDTQTVEGVLSDFFFRQEDGWHHARCDKEIAEYHRLKVKNRENGKKGGRPKAARDKAENPLGFQWDATSTPVETNSKGNQEPGTNNQEPLTSKESSSRSSEGIAALTAASLTAFGVDIQHAKDWIKVRKAPLTRTAWEAVVREANAAGISLDDAVRVSAENSWRGFKADWYTNLQRRTHAAPQVGKQDAVEQRNRQTAKRWAESRGAGQQGGFDAGE